MSRSASGPGEATRDLLALLLVAIVAGLPRLLFLDSDPPGQVGAAFLTDEGWWAHNARQFALFGQWVMDDNNLAMYSTPAYTVALAGIYKLFGLGFYQTRLLSGFSGIVTCLAVFGMVRPLGRRVATGSALLVALSFPMLLHNRIGLTESFKLMFLALAAAAVIHSIRRPAWGVAAGVCMVLAILAKTSAVIMPLVTVLFWGAHWFLSRRGHAERFSWRPVLWTLVAGVVTTGVIAVVFVWPHWADVRHHLLSPIRSATGALLTDRIQVFGTPLALGLTEFYISSIVLILTVVVLLLQRLGGTRLVELHLVELFCWLWAVAGVGFLSVLTYQPFRRFLLVVPPLAVLAGIALFQGTLVLPGRDHWKAQPRYRRFAAVVIVSAVLAYYLTVALLPLLLPRIGQAAGGGTEGISSLALRNILWHALFLGLAGLAVASLALLPGWGIRVSPVAVVLLFLLVEPVRFAASQLPLRFTIRDASRAIATQAQRDGLPHAAVVGNTADTFALETELYAFTIRKWVARKSYMNLEGERRYRPAYAIEMRRSDQYRLEDEEERRGTWKLVGSYPVWDEGGRRPVTRIGLFRTGVAHPRTFERR